MSSSLPKISAATFSEVGSADFSATQFVGMENLGMTTTAIGASVAQSSSRLSSAGQNVLTETMKDNPVAVTLPRKREDGPTLPMGVMVAARSKGNNEPQVG